MHTCWATAASQCEPHIKVPRGSLNTLTADAAITTRTLDPSFFGFNLEWLEFQTGLWDAKNQRVLPGVISIFRDFPGAIYRYPGGTNSNHFDWQDSVGPVNVRLPRKHASWLGPLRAEFGIDEYLQFVEDVGGKAWYVANLYGAYDAAKPPSELAANAGRLSAYASQRSHQGMPSIYRWELGNELDRGTLKWPPGRVADAALQVSTTIKQADPSAKFVAFQQEYPAQADKGYSAARYNKELRAATAPLVPEFAMHFYYDGPPDAPPVSYFLKQLCQVVDDAKAEGSQANVWITEHGRVPNGFWAKTPKSMWPETANMTAATSMADLLIALTQIPEARGAFAHSLVTTTSPWPLVHKREGGAIDPTVTLLGMKLLRESLLPNVVKINQTANGDGWQGDAYAIRSALLTNNERTAFTLWTVNKSNAPQLLKFRLIDSHADITFDHSVSLSDEQGNTNNYVSATRIQLKRNDIILSPNGVGSWTLNLPPNSVNALSFGLPK